MHARNFVANSNYCPHCLSASPTNANGEFFPNGVNGICGDPYLQVKPRDHEANGKFWTGVPKATFKEGQVVNLNVFVTAYHKGNFEFRVCKINGLTAEDEASQLTEECLDAGQLYQADVPGAQVPGNKYYFIGPTSEGLTGSNWDYNMKFKLPEGLNCDGKTSRCVMQWHWITGNSCNPPETPAKYNSPQLTTCGRNSPYPEEFWNCADILIEPTSSTSDTPPSPNPPSPNPPLPNPPSPNPPSPNPPSPNPPSPNPPSPNSPSPEQSSNPSTPEEEFCFDKLQSGGQYGYYADESSDCSKFYRCEASGSWHMDCPVGTRFNQKISNCDWPQNVDCGTNLSPANAFCSTKSKYGLYADVESGCEKFYRCEATGSWHMDCQPGSLFNEKISNCDWPENVQC
ncbi:hypothetical protein M9434_004654 [Picochlorum sp. BPE23]|nr:hypothetical protein M9434_004654 [Picochlorum sp. BPE23]